LCKKVASLPIGSHRVVTDGARAGGGSKSHDRYIEELPTFMRTYVFNWAFSFVS